MKWRIESVLLLILVSVIVAVVFMRVTETIERQRKIGSLRPGQVWVDHYKTPFSEKWSTNVVVAVKDGWTRYTFGDGLTNETLSRVFVLGATLLK